MLKPTKFQTNLFINNEFVKSSNNSKIPVINPADESIICYIEEAVEQDVEKAILAAEQAFKTWKYFPAKERGRLIYKLAQLTRENLLELAALESLDNGKPQCLSTIDIQMVAESLEFFAGQSDKISGKTFSMNEQNYLTSYRREAFGVVGLISPWNYPLLMACWKFAPALASGNIFNIIGNTIVLKVSEETPLSSLRFCELILQAGFPPGIFNLVPGYGNVAGEYMINHQKIKKISFTGSTLVGRKIQQASANSNLKQTHLELGGKSPFIVCPDVDLDYVAQQAWDAIMTNMGQVCDCGSRLFVHESIYEQLIEKIIKKNEQIIIGDAFSSDQVNFGPLINKRQYQLVLNYIDIGKNQEKLELVLGGNPVQKVGYFIEPTIFKNVPDNSKLAINEIFGPVLCIMKPWKTLDEVIERANNTKYGLAAYVFSNDFNSQEKLIQNLDAGSVYCNMLSYASPHVPFGGYKESGFGRDNGIESVHEFTQIKSIYQAVQKPNI